MEPSQEWLGSPAFGLLISPGSKSLVNSSRQSATCLMRNDLSIPEKFLWWHSMCSSSNRLARNETCPRRHHFSERRLPLRQPPAEQPFSRLSETWNPVRNDWVLPLLRGAFSLAHRLTTSNHCRRRGKAAPILSPEVYQSAVRRRNLSPSG